MSGLWRLFNVHGELCSYLRKEGSFGGHGAQPATNPSKTTHCPNSGEKGLMWQLRGNSPLFGPHKTLKTGRLGQSLETSQHVTCVKKESDRFWRFLDPFQDPSVWLEWEPDTSSSSYSTKHRVNPVICLIFFFFLVGVQIFPFLTTWPKKRAPKKHYKNRGFSNPFFGKQSCVTKRPFFGQKNKSRDSSYRFFFCLSLLFQQNNTKLAETPIFIVF